METPLKRTPLHDTHVKAGARMVPFGGWHMPVQYTGIVEEHRAVRSAVGLFDVRPIGYYRFAAGTVAGVAALVSRTGYTGEDGFELYVPAADAVRLWTALLDAGAADGAVPIGLGARDTLRLEMGYALYGNDIDRTTNPIEAGLGWIVKLGKGEFIGRAAIERVTTQGPRRTLTGLEMVDRSVPRHGYPVVRNGTGVGTVTSGSYGPSVDKSIPLAYVDAPHAATGTALGVDIRGQARAARVVRPPFWRPRVKQPRHTTR